MEIQHNDFAEQLSKVIQRLVALETECSILALSSKKEEASHDKSVSNMKEESRGKPAEILNDVEVPQSPSETVSVSSADLLEAQRFYDIRASSYDSMLFVGTPYFGWSGSLKMGISILSCCFIQSVLCIIVKETMTPHSDNYNGILNGHLAFRTNVAGRFMYLDPVTKASLGSRVCNVDSYDLEIGGLQQSTVVELRRYLDSGDDTILRWASLSSSPGQIMCMCSVLGWLLVVSTEIRLAHLFVRAVFQIDYGSVRVICNGGIHDLQLVSVSSFRRGVVVLSSLIRVSIAILLGYSGSMWLIATQSIDDVLLNACALTFVFEFDHLLFEAAAPTTILGFMESLQPLGIRGHSHNTRLVFFVVSPAFMVLLIVYTIITLHYVPKDMGYRRDVLDALCKGFTDFVYEFDGAGIPYWAESKHLKSTTSTKNTLLNRVILAVTKDPNSQLWNKLPSLSGSLSSLETFTRQSPAETASLYNSDCADVFLESSPVGPGPLGLAMLDMMRGALGNSTFASCLGIDASVCRELSRSGLMARQFCSARCGCRSAISTNHRATVLRGCPNTCPYLADYWSNPHVPNCTQLSDLKLIKNPAWIDYVSGMETNALDQDSVGGSDPNLRFVRNLSSQGCQAINHYRQYVGEADWIANSDVCTSSGSRSMFKPLAVWCPETCGCAAKWQSTCPLSCRNNAS